MTQIFTSWNPLTSWLRQVDRLRHAAAKFESLTPSQSPFVRSRERVDLFNARNGKTSAIERAVRKPHCEHPRLFARIWLTNQVRHGLRKF